MYQFKNLNPYDSNFNINNLIDFLENNNFDTNKFNDIKINKKTAFNVFDKLIFRKINEPNDIIKYRQSLNLWKKLVES